MQVSLNPDLEAGLGNLAAQQGRDTGKSIEHREIGRLINSRYPG